MSKLIALYKDILEYASMRPNAKGEIDVVFDETQKPALIDKKRLMMPTEANLKAYDPDTQVIFHPFQEFVDRGESDVVKRLRQQLNVRINYATFVVTAALFRIVASPSIHKDLTPEQRELLLAIPKVDGNTEKNYTDFVIKHYGGHENRFFTNIYLKKSGTYQGVKHPRIGVVTFPFYEFLQNPELKIRKLDRENFHAMLKFVFPDSDSDPEAFNSFSDNHEAPWLNALLKTSHRLTSRINELIELYGDHITEAETLKFNLDWVEPLDNLKSYRSEILKIPAQRGNSGASTSEETQAQEAPKPAAAPATIPMPAPSPAPTPVQPMPMPMYQQPTQQPQMVYYPGSPGVPPGCYDLMQLPVQLRQFAQPMQQGPQMYPMQSPQPMQHMQAPPPVEKTPEGKMSFSSIERSNPMVAMSGNVPTPLNNPWMSQMPQMMPQMPQQMVAQGPGIPALAPTGQMYFPGGQQMQMVIPGYVQPLTPQQMMMQQQAQYGRSNDIYNV